MTTLTNIINAAFRETGITPTGGAPDSNESAEALTILINFINSLYFEEIGEHLTDYAVGINGITYGPPFDQTTTTVIKPNSRLVCNLTGATTLYMPVMPHDGSLLAIVDASNNFGTYNLTLNGNGRPISGSASLVLNSNGYFNLFFYDGVASSWVAVPVLSSAGDSSPFATRWDDLLSIGLAIRIAPRFGGTIRPETTQAYTRVLKQFKRRFAHSEEVPSEIALTHLPGNPYSHVWNFQSFNLGR